MEHIVTGDYINDPQLLTELERLRKRVAELEQENSQLKDPTKNPANLVDSATPSADCSQPPTNFSHLYQTVMHATMGMATMSGPTHIYEAANPLYLDRIGRDSTILGKPVREVISEFSGKNLFKLLDQVYQSGETFIAKEMITYTDRKGDGILEELIYNLVYQPLFGSDGQVDGIAVYALNVKEQVMDRQILQNERQRLQQIFMNAPASIAVLRGTNHVFELANPNYMQLIGRKTPITGLSLVEALPEIESQGFVELLNGVYESGQPFIGSEIEVLLDRDNNNQLETVYLNFVYQPLLSAITEDTPVQVVEGILVHAVDVTEQVTARHQLEQLFSDQQRQREVLEMAQRAGNIGSFEWFVAEDRIIWTPELEALYGLAEGGFESQYENWAKRVHPDDLPRAEASLWGATQGGPPYNVEFRVVWPDSTIRWMLAKGDVYTSEQGKTQRVLGVNIDITERKQAEQALQASEERFKWVAQVTNDAIWDWHLATNEVWWSEGVQKLFDYSVQEVKSDISWWHDHIHPEDRERVLTHIDGVIADVTNQQEWAEEYRYQKSDGNYVDVLDRGYVIREASTGKALRMLGAMLDITQRKEVERLKDAFLGIASHELKTPITSLKGFIEIIKRNLRTLLLKVQAAASEGQPNASLLDRGLDRGLDLGEVATSVEKILRSVQVVEQQTTRMNELTNRLLDATRIQTGKLELQFNASPINLVGLVEQVVESLTYNILDHLLLLEINDIDRQAGIYATIDDGRIVQVVTNLINNAVKYSLSNTTIIVGVSRMTSLPDFLAAQLPDSFLEGNQIVVWVQDEGYGLSPEQQAHLFERFYRVRTTQNQAVSGLGLGLYLSREIVSAHQGQMGVISQEGVGSTFYFSLPQ